MRILVIHRAQKRGRRLVRHSKSTTQRTQEQPKLPQQIEPNPESQSESLDDILEKLPPKLRFEVLDKVEMLELQKMSKGRFVFLSFVIVLLTIVWTIPLVVVGMACVATVLLWPIGLNLMLWGILPPSLIFGKIIENKVKEAYKKKNQATP